VHFSADDLSEGDGMLVVFSAGGGRQTIPVSVQWVLGSPNSHSHIAGHYRIN
jgi:hypothetical protein